MLLIAEAYCALASGPSSMVSTFVPFSCSPHSSALTACYIGYNHARLRFGLDSSLITAVVLYVVLDR